VNAGKITAATDRVEYPGMSGDRQRDVFRFLHQLGERLEQTREEDKLLRTAVRSTLQYFAADDACLATVTPGRPQAEALVRIPPGRDWDLRVLTRYARRQPVEIPAQLMLGALHRRGRTWGVLAVRRATGEFSRDELPPLTAVARTLSEALRRRDEQRGLEVRARLDRMIVAQLRPRDLFYQVLDGVRALTRYDHSSALLVARDEGRSLELVAEQIACVKRKSRSIGRRLALEPMQRRQLESGVVFGFSADGVGWREWSGRDAAGLAELLDFERGATDATRRDVPREGCLICAPIAGRGGLIGVLKVSGQHAGALGQYEAELLRHFTAQASVAIQVLARTEALELRILDAERKHAIANIARGVSHDVNNALGSVLPLVQQLRDEARDGRLDAGTLARDLAQIEQALQTGRRIFGGMLSLARGGPRTVGEGNVRRAIDGALEIVRDGLVRRGVELRVDVVDDLPGVRAGQGDLTQLLLNLVSNARDAMANGGRLLLRARAVDGAVEIEVEDNGCGIPAELLPRIEEPFFSTKPDGHGLGLSICRAIVAAVGGAMRIESRPAAGTTVHVSLPAGPTQHPGAAT
jgi:signal transduction histidine kinase